ncbi:MAG TPA: hypothetical protein VHW01_05245 [Polyangiaceae bacterium]|jgi:hypothetical protein|nr:hypothetical protein [Polyangiaceae bacterium]
MKNSKYHDDFDDFEDWAAATVAPQFEPVATKLRRLAPLTVTWRGGVHRFEPEARLMFGQRTAVLSLISLWGPTAAGWPIPRRSWVADVYVKDFGFVQGKGATPRAALDALDAELPTAPLVLGGSC